MEGMKSCGDLTGNSQSLRIAQSANTVQAGLERFPAKKLHGNKRNTLLFTNLMDGDDVVMFDMSIRRIWGWPQ